MGLVFALSLPACMIGPDFQRPTAQLENHWIDTGSPSVDSKHRQDAHWWASLRDPVLAKLIILARQQNLSLRSAGIRVLQARAQLGFAIGELYPQQQQLTGAITNNKLPVSVPYDAVSTTYWQSTLGAQAAWEIDLWGKIRRGIESADDTFLASVADYDDVLVSLIGDVANIYVRIRTLETQLAIAQENIVRQRLALTIAKARFEGGVVTKRDVYQAENVLGSTEAAVPQLTYERRRATNALSVLLGLAPTPLDGLLAGGSGIPVTPESLAAGIPADLLRRRPEIRKAELRAAAQCAQIGYAKGELLPAFTLVGNVNTVSSDIGKASLGKLFSAGSMAYSAGPTVTWNILNYGQITNNVRMQDAKFQELLVDYQHSVLRAQQEVEDGIAKFDQSRQEAVFLGQSVEAAKGAMDIALLQYKDGVADFTTVLNAEENLYKAQNALAETQGKIALGLVKTYRAMGGGWELREPQDFVPKETQQEMANRTDWGTLLTPDLLHPKAPTLPGAEDAGPMIRPPEW